VGEATAATAMSNSGIRSRGVGGRRASTSSQRSFLKLTGSLPLRQSHDDAKAVFEQSPCVGLFDANQSPLRSASEPGPTPSMTRAARVRWSSRDYSLGDPKRYYDKRG